MSPPRDRKERTMKTKKAMDAKDARWAAGFRLGLAIAEADVLDAADRIQILDAAGNVLFTATIEDEEVRDAARPR
jgi:hypothetical protein